MCNSRVVPLSLSLVALGLLVAAQALAGPGDFDKTFGKRGKVLLEGEAVDVATQSDRKVLVLRQDEREGDPAVIVSRLRRNGKVDMRFGRNGRTAIPLAGDEHAAGLALQANGRIVVGFTSDPSGSDRLFGVARLRPNGALDDSLDGDGIQTSGFGSGFDALTARDVGVGADGQIVLVGNAYPTAGDFHPYFAVAQYDTNGQLDGSFSGDGVQTTDITGVSNVATAVAVDSQGRVVAAGTARQGGSQIALARYDESGELDSSFAGDGTVLSGFATLAEDVIALPDDRIVVASGVSSDFLVARFGEDGTPDSSFAGDGAKVIDFSDGADTAFELARDGQKLVAAGSSRTHLRGTDYAVARIRRNGKLDRRFSDDGLRQVDFGGEDRAHGVAVDRTGDVVLGGEVNRRGRRDVAGIARLRG